MVHKEGFFTSILCTSFKRLEWVVAYNTKYKQTILGMSVVVTVDKLKCGHNTRRDYYTILQDIPHAYIKLTK